MNLFSAKIKSAVYNSLACAIERGEDIPCDIVVHTSLRCDDFWEVMIVCPVVTSGYAICKSGDKCNGGFISQSTITALAAEAVADFITV